MEKATTRNKQKYYNDKVHLSKGIYIVKVRNHPHTNILPKSEIVRRVQMQDTADALAIKRPTTIDSISKLQGNYKPKLCK